MSAPFHDKGPFSVFWPKSSDAGAAPPHTHTHTRVIRGEMQTDEHTEYNNEPWNEREINWTPIKKRLTEMDYPVCLTVFSSFKIVFQFSEISIIHPNSCKKKLHYTWFWAKLFVFWKMLQFFCACCFFHIFAITLLHYSLHITHWNMCDFAGYPTAKLITHIPFSPPGECMQVQHSLSFSYALVRHIW